jgi:hypothetical protein
MMSTGPEQIAECAACGVAAAVVVTGELMAAGSIEAGSAWAPLNAVAPLLLTPETADVPGWEPAITPTGLAITVSGLAAWAALHHLAVSQLPSPARTSAGRLAVAALSAGALAFFDYRLLPRQRRPRFARWISPAAIAAKYALFGLALATIHPRDTKDKER